MKNTEQSKRQLILEVEKNGFRRLIYRITNPDGSFLFMEETDLEDFSRPIREAGDFNVYFNEQRFWKAFVQFTSCEGLLNRQIWHQTTNEWLELTPIFIHADMKQLVQRSLAEATRELNPDNHRQIEGIRTWLQKLSQPTAVVKNPYLSVGREIMNAENTYRHAV